MITIRNFENDADYEAMADIYNSVWEHKITADYVRERDSKRSSEFFLQRVAAEWDEQIVGVGSYGVSSNAYMPGKYSISMTVYPDYQRRGIATRFFEHVTSILAEYDPKPVKFSTGTFENRVGAVSMLDKLGFKPMMREVVAGLDVENFDPASFAWAFKKIEENNILIHTLQELMNSDPNWQHHFHQLAVAIELDIPSIDTPTPPISNAITPTAPRYFPMRSTELVRFDSMSR